MSIYDWFSSHASTPGRPLTREDLLPTLRQLDQPTPYEMHPTQPHPTHPLLTLLVGPGGASGDLPYGGKVVLTPQVGGRHLRVCPSCGGRFPQAQDCWMCHGMTMIVVAA